jgi:hypothetical protein
MMLGKAILANQGHSKPPTAATTTTIHGGSFQAINSTKHRSASVTSRVLPIERVNPEEYPH